MKAVLLVGLSLLGLGLLSMLVFVFFNIRPKRQTLDLTRSIWSVLFSLGGFLVLLALVTMFIKAL